MNDDDIRKRVTEIIYEGDLDTLTFKGIYKTLQGESSSDLEEKKKFIRQLVGEITEERIAKSKPKEEKNEEEKEEPEKAEEEVEAKNEESDHEEEEDDEGSDDDEEEEAPKKAKKIKTKEKAKEVKGKEKRKRDEIEDDIEQIEGERKLQKILLDNLQYGSARQTRSNRKGPPPPLKKKKKSTKNDGEEGAPKKRKNSGFTKPLWLSPALSEFLGEEKLSRPEISKRLTAYIKEHQLQDKNDGRKIIFDEKLSQLFGKRKTTTFFKINSLISKHVKTENEL